METDTAPVDEVTLALNPAGIRLSQFGASFADEVEEWLAHEVSRWQAFVVRGPTDDDCWLWSGAVGDDAYGRFWLSSARGQRRVVRPHRYAVALYSGLTFTPADIVMHDCDVPLCVRADDHGHLLVGTQQQNLAMMGQRGRGGGSWWRRRWLQTDRATRYARSRALREVVRDHGWDVERMRAAVHSVQAPDQLTLF